MAKDKKKKKKGKSKQDGGASSAADRLKALSQNPLVAEVITAALVATAAALKEPKKARQLAEQAGDELRALSKDGVERGNAMWDLALEIGRRTLDTLTADDSAKRKAARQEK
jgi:hypothetical protein